MNGDAHRQSEVVAGERRKTVLRKGRGAISSEEVMAKEKEKVLVRTRSEGGGEESSASTCRCTKRTG
jgi:hypothetical protein